MIGQQGKVLTAETELLLHQFAYGSYKSGQFEQSVRTFRLLTMFRASDFRYWYGLACSLMGCSKEHDAIQPFQIACVLAKEDPRPRLYLAECLLLTAQIEEAGKVLCEAEVLDLRSNSTFHENIQMLKERLIQRETSLCQI
jgi:Flp pilus assembly protein TadD